MGKQKRLIVRENAYKELETQLDYFIEHDSKEYALRFAAEFVEELNRILPNYNSFPECRYLMTKKRLYRNIIWGNFWIIYKIKTDSVEVLSLFHTRGDPDKLKRLRRI